MAHVPSRELFAQRFCSVPAGAEAACWHDMVRSCLCACVFVGSSANVVAIFFHSDGDTVEIVWRQMECGCVFAITTLWVSGLTCLPYKNAHKFKFATVCRLTHSCTYVGPPWG